MVISDQHKYLFIELYRTGSTAISSELCALYDGRKILNKHSRYREFLKVATPEQKEYFAFAGIRNPMDVVVSGYIKLKKNHKGRFTNPAEWRRNGGTISDELLKLYEKVKDLSFEEYFRKFYIMPYDNWSSITHRHLDFVIRFEHMQEDFATVLKMLNIEPQREIPLINKTEGKADFYKYYTPEIRKHAIFIFGPFMKKWGYTFPEDWKVDKITWASRFLYKAASILKHTYWEYTKTKSVPA